MSGKIFLRVATQKDTPAIRALQFRAIDELQRGYLTSEQIAASHASMGLDTQLIEDGTYFCVIDPDWVGNGIIVEGGTLVGCGGWSFRATLYGGDHSEGRSVRALDPKRERARIRAMYTHPEHTRRGIGRMVIEAGERAAAARGFSDLEMAATEAGKPFYRRCGYTVESAWTDENGGVPIPLYTMVKSI